MALKDKGWTRKRALYSRVSHSTVCTTMVSTKKTHPTLMIQVCSCVYAACVSGKCSCKCEREMCVCASNQAWVCVCVCVSSIINKISSIQLLACVCSGSAPTRDKNGRVPRFMCVIAREIKGGYVCVSVIFTLQWTTTCVFMYINTAKRLRLYKTVFTIIMKYFVLKNSLLFKYNYNMQPYQ